MMAKVSDFSAALPADVQHAFAFMAGFGFSCVSASSPNVRFESDRVYVEVRLSERDGEVSIQFGRLGTDEEFSFTLFLRLVNPELERALGNRLVENRAQLAESLEGLSGALQQEGQPILRGDNLLFERMQDVRWWDFQPEALKK